MKQSTALTILKEGHNVFLTGEAGSGKSYTLRQFIQYLQERNMRVAITASTGIAATILGGSTIHSYSQIGIKDVITATDIYNMRRKPPVVEKMKNVDVLILDEISMLHARQLDMVNYVFKCIRNDFRPFGGVQVVFAGDFFQLPPVGGESPVEKFAFMSESWKEADLRVCYLTEQHRQSDNDLNHILNAIRSDTVLPEHEEKLLETFENKLSDLPTKLYTHNMNVDYENNSQLAAIDSPPRVYKAATEGRPNDVKFLETNVLSPPILTLKVGAKVMFTKNHPEGLYVNGTMGVIKSLGIVPVVETEDGDIDATHQRWEKVNDFGNVVASYTQVPLRLAWAITVHKCVDPSTYVSTSQGLQQIKDIASEGLILTTEGYKPYVNLISNPATPGKKFKTTYGYTLPVTADHNCSTWDGSKWIYREAKDLKVGDWLRLKLGEETDLVQDEILLPETCTIFRKDVQIFKVPKSLDSDLALFLGMMFADGTVRERSFSLTKKHLDSVLVFKQLCENIFGYEGTIKTLNVGGSDFYQLEVSSKYLTTVLFKELFPTFEPKSKEIPWQIKQSSLRIQEAFLKGLFEDSTVNLKKGKVDHIEFTNKEEHVCTYVQQILLKLGIISSLVNRTKGAYTLSTIYIYGIFCKIYKDKIGFVNNFLTQRLENNSFAKTDRNGRVPLPRSTIKDLAISKSMRRDSLLRGYVGREYIPENLKKTLDYYYVQISSIEDTLAESMCVSVPGVGNFIQNGFVGSNCQGLTLQEAEVDLSQTFEWGQGYVALSRLRNIENLKVLGLNEKSLKLSPLARKADARFKELSQDLAEAYGELEDE